MFKLVAVGGKLRGKEIILNDGENVLGRSVECDHQVAVDGISKKHLRVTVNGETAFAYTSVFAVPKSIARSFENQSSIFLNIKNILSISLTF